MRTIVIIKLILAHEGRMVALAALGGSCWSLLLEKERCLRHHLNLRRRLNGRSLHCRLRRRHLNLRRRLTSRSTSTKKVVNVVKVQPLSAESRLILI